MCNRNGGLIIQECEYSMTKESGLKLMMIAGHYGTGQRQSGKFTPAKSVFILLVCSNIP